MLLINVFNKRRGLSAVVAMVALFIPAPVAADAHRVASDELPIAAPTPSPSSVDPAPSGPEAEVPSEGPVVDLPDAIAPAEPSAAAPADDTDLVRGLRDRRFDEAASSGSVLGGYGELHYNLTLPTHGDPEARLDLHRLVFFAAHKFSAEFRLYAELEIEHAFASANMPGEVEVEQAFIDWKPWGKALQLRIGIMPVPMGIINEWHEPPVFNGVERPRVDTVIIPSTWREGGVGIFGEPVEGLRYQLYLMGGLNAARFSLAGSIRGGRQGVAESVANGPAVAGRIEWEPTLGVVFGGSAYYGVAGPNAGKLHRLVGRDPITDAPILEDLELGVPVLGLEADARVRLQGFEARAVLATFSIGDAAALREAVDETRGDRLGIDVGSRTIGAYAEVAYDVLRLMTTTDQHLLPFVRVEYWDTAAELASRARTATDETLRGTDLVLGLSYRPILQVVLKADFILRTPGGVSPSQRLVDVGVGWMF